MPEDNDSSSTTDDSTANAKTSFVFWRRIFAFQIDGVLLGILGAVLGAFFFNSLMAIGSLGRLLGLSICLLYSGIFNSSIGRGQTVGKRVMHIKVINSCGQYISLPKSLLRAAIIWTPMMLNGVFYNLHVPQFVSQILFAVDLLVIFALGGGLIYLFVFNMPTRQSIQDLAVGSFVVQNSTNKISVSSHLWKGHWVILLLFGAAVLAGGIVIPQILERVVTKDPFYAEHAKIVDAIEHSGEVAACRVSTYTSFFMEDFTGSKQRSNTSTYLLVDAACNSNPNTDPGKFQRIAALVANTSPAILKQYPLRIRLSYGYDIGIASFHGTQDRDFTLNQLKELTRK